MERKAFTLVELLVVIAVISLLSSIVLASLNASRDRAKVAAISSFEASIFHALGDQLQGQWSFDEGTSTVARDTSGNGYNGVINGATYVTGMRGTALSFNGTSNNVFVSGAPNLNITGPITFAAWVKTNSLYSSTYGGIAWGTGGGTSLDSYFVLSDARVMLSLSLGGTRRAFTSAALLATNTWYYVVGTWDGTNMKIYIDGKLDSTSGPYAGALSISPTGSLYIGQYGGGSTYYFNGIIDEERIYANSLTAAQIEKLYAEGAPRHPIAVE